MGLLIKSNKFLMNFLILNYMLAALCNTLKTNVLHDAFQCILEDLVEKYDWIGFDGLVIFLTAVGQMLKYLKFDSDKDELSGVI